MEMMCGWIKQSKEKYGYLLRLYEIMNHHTQSVSIKKYQGELRSATIQQGLRTSNVWTNEINSEWDIIRIFQINLKE